MTGLRERKLIHTRHAIALAAWTLFQQHGAASVSMRDIAELAEVSERSVHNHFATKSELIAAALDLADPVGQHAQLLELRPADEHPLTAFRLAIAEAGTGLTDAHARTTVSVLRAIRRDPDLYGISLTRTATRSEALAGVLAERGARHGLDAVQLAVACAQCLTAIEVIASHQPDRPRITDWLAQIDDALARVERAWTA